MNIHRCCLLINLCPTLCEPMDYIACQAPLSMGFFRQEHWSGLPSPSPEDLPDPGIKPVSPALQVNLLPLSYQGSPEPTKGNYVHMFSHSVISDSLWPYGQTASCHAPLSMGFSRQEYWSGVPPPSPVDLPHLGTELASPALQADFSPLRCQVSPFRGPTNY